LDGKVWIGRMIKVKIGEVTIELQRADQYSEAELKVIKELIRCVCDLLIFQEKRNWKPKMEKPTP